MIGSEDPYLIRIGQALAGPNPASHLRALGVRWVLLEKGNGTTPTQLPTGSVAFDDQGLELVDLGTPGPSTRSHPAIFPVVGADAATLLLLLIALAGWFRHRSRRRSCTGLPGSRIVVANWRDLEHSHAGGAERYAWELARALTEAGARVEFLTAHERGQLRTEHRDGIQIVRRGGQFTFYPRALLFLLRRRWHLDAVIDADCGIPVFSPLVLSRRTAVLLVVHHVHYDQFGLHFPRPLAILGRWLEGTLMPRMYRTATTVAVSPSTAAEMRNRLRWEGPIDVLLNGSSAPTPATTDSEDNELDLIVVLGRLASHKRVDLIMRAVAGLRPGRPALRVDVIGTGPELDRLQELVRELSLDKVVTFHGFVDEPTKAALLGAARLQVCASDAEGWGQVVIEAASYGVPTLARNVPGLCDSVLPGRTGWLLNDSSPEDSQALINRLRNGIEVALDELADDAQRQHLAANCRTWASHFSWQAMHTETIGLVTGALKRGRERANRARPDY